ncbi:MAG: hypothetical protein ISS01_01910, partial [Nanoarchaeota archaeon]|nr:hypothetical protein [Nanoarchaeota archaeon]
ISSCREFSLNSQLSKIYDERNKLYVIPIWHRRSISFDVYIANQEHSIISKPVSNVLGIGELRAVSVFVKNCRNLDENLIVAEALKLESGFYFEVYY